jgi:hypothetical protein
LDREQTDYWNAKFRCDLTNFKGRLHDLSTGNVPGLPHTVRPELDYRPRVQQKIRKFFCALGLRQAIPIRAKSRCERPAGTLKAWARELGLDDAGGLLEETLEEEKDTDATLTEMAESVINRRVEAAE